MLLLIYNDSLQCCTSFHDPINVHFYILNLFLHFQFLFFSLFFPFESVTMFKNVPYDEWWHHILFGVGIGGVGLHYCPGPIQNALCFLISGFPGGVDYAMLALIKDGVMKPKTEKLINGWMNAWVRGPGLTMVGFAMFLAAKYGRTSMPTWAAAICGALSWFNGNYYAARVVASAGQNGWRPS